MSRNLFMATKSRRRKKTWRNADLFHSVSCYTLVCTCKVWNRYFTYYHLIFKNHLRTVESKGNIQKNLKFIDYRVLSFLFSDYQFFYGKQILQVNCQSFPSLYFFFMGCHGKLKKKKKKKKQLYNHCVAYSSEKICISTIESS